MRFNRAREKRALGILNIPYAGTQKMMFAFLILTCAALLFVQPLQKKKEEAKKEEVKSAGDMMVEIHWPDKVDIDIDLWGKSPDDDRPVGYSNRAGKTFNILRDDLGRMNDSTDRNFEMLYARGLPAGEYIINLHYYMNRDPSFGDAEVPVDVIISTKTKAADEFSYNAGGMRQIIMRKALLRNQGEEITVVRFVIKEDGELDSESVNDFYQELRSWQPPTQ